MNNAHTLYTIFWISSTIRILPAGKFPAVANGEILRHRMSHHSRIDLQIKWIAIQYFEGITVSAVMGDSEWPVCSFSFLHSYNPPSESKSQAINIEAPSPDDLSAIQSAIKDAATRKPSLLSGGGDVSRLQEEEAELDRKLAELPVPAGIEEKYRKLEARRKRVEKMESNFNLAMESHRAKIHSGANLSRLLILETYKRINIVSAAQSLGPVTVPDVDAIVSKGLQDPATTLQQLEKNLKALPALQRKKK
jgi:hypothetical protein